MLKLSDANKFCRTALGMCLIAGPLLALVGASSPVGRGRHDGRLPDPAVVLGHVGHKILGMSDEECGRGEGPVLREADPVVETPVACPARGRIGGRLM